MGNCWVLCAGLIRRGTGRIQKGGGSKYFRSRNAGGHYTIEFENLVESDEEEIPQNCPRAISEEELGHLRAQQYTAISDKQTLIDERLQAELAEQEEKLRLEEEAQCAAQREAARLARARRQQEQQEQREKIDTDISSQRGHQNAMMMESNPGAQLQSMKGQEEVMRSRSLSRALPDQDNSGTEDTQQALVVQPGDHLDGRPASTALEWENDFVSAHGEDSADSEYDGFVNPVLDSTSSEPSSRSTTDQQDR
ncbi:AP-1 complex-associated regulatory protein-like isoform X3 [Scleropages formosus]|uniref:AP-1 complex-associated regulatory protein-like isoform X3 n=1 Tax=Scleropages formosus TaxID=113540 RepID=UPI00087900CE|nr:AP-1 complex-associated regulatory protein-like isoform X3 [Scleropages formosus]